MHWKPFKMGHGENEDIFMVKFATQTRFVSSSKTFLADQASFVSLTLERSFVVENSDYVIIWVGASPNSWGLKKQVFVQEASFDVLVFKWWRFLALFGNCCVGDSYSLLGALSNLASASKSQLGSCTHARSAHISVDSQRWVHFLRLA